MSATTVPALGLFLGVLRRNRVRRFKGVVDGDAMELEFELDAVSSGPPELDVEMAKCDCGHAVSDHNESGECIHGCRVEKCST